MTPAPINPRSRAASWSTRSVCPGRCALYAAEDVGGNPVADLAAEARPYGCPHCGRSAGAGTSWRDAIVSRSPRRFPPVDPESLAQIQFTSGTTGRAKGVQITHAGMVATGRAFADRLGPTAGRVWLNPMPLFHTAGNVLGVVGARGRAPSTSRPPGSDPSPRRGRSPTGG